MTVIKTAVYTYSDFLKSGVFYSLVTNAPFVGRRVKKSLVDTFLYITEFAVVKILGSDMCPVHLGSGALEGAQGREGKYALLVDFPLFGGYITVFAFFRVLDLGTWIARCYQWLV